MKEDNSLMEFARRLRVLHFTAMWPTEEFPNNGTFVKNLVDGLRNTGGVHDVLFIPAYRSKIEYFKAFKRLKDTLRREKYNLIHTQYAHCALIAGLVSNIPVVGHFHNEFGYRKKIEVFDSAPNIKTYMKDSAMARFSSHLISGSIVVNPYDLRFLHSKYKIVIPIGIDTELFHPIDRKKACKILGWDTTPLRVLFPSNPERPEKNYKLFKKVFSRLKKVFPNIQEIILNNIPYEKVPLYMNAVDLMLLTSKTEASPTVIKEANACNLPVLSTLVGDVKEQLEGVNNSYVLPPSSADKFYNKALSILKSRQRSNGIAKKTRIDLEITVRKTLKFYMEILDGTKK